MKKKSYVSQKISDMNPTAIVIFARYLIYLSKWCAIFPNKNDYVLNKLYSVPMPDNAIGTFDPSIFKSYGDNKNKTCRKQL